jgi:dipeptidyl aminopeptidase/acylaminoacyl peptidase
MRKKLIYVLFAVLGVIGVKMYYSLKSTKDKTLIPREVLFGNPDKTNVNLSPNGTYLAYLAPVKGVLNIWVQNLKELEAPRPITQNKDRGISDFSWTYDGNYILYIVDKGGNENWNLHTVNLTTGEDKEITHENKVQTRIIKLSHLHPHEIIIGLNNRDPRYHDLYLIDLQTGDKKLVYKNMEGYDDFSFDAHFNLHFVAKTKEDGTLVYYQNKGSGDQPIWTPFIEFTKSEQGSSRIVYVDQAGRFSYWLDARGHDKAVLKKIDLKTQEEVILASLDKSDMSGAQFSLKTDRPFVAYGYYDKVKRIILDRHFLDVFKAAEELHQDSEFFLASDFSHQTWLVKYLSDVYPVRYYLYDRRTKKFTFLFSHKKALELYKLSPMHFIEIQARDGLVLPSYLTYPKGFDSKSKNKKPVPLVVYVHGGPWARDTWGFSSLSQWLADRGYAVLQVNYRGSTGFGKAFFKKSFGEWGGKMHEDILDAIQWAINQKIADPKKIAIYGGSYGGYEVLWGMTQNPDLFSLGVSLVGPSNLVTLINSIPPYWTSSYEWFVRTIGGDPKKEGGKRFLENRSPLTYADQIKNPLLIVQGANDVRVKKAESDQIVQALKSKKIPVTYLVFPNEGHGLTRPEDRLYFIAVMEQMLAKVLGGNAEPIKDEKSKANVKIEENSLNLNLGG